MIGQRKSDLFCDNAAFEKAAPEYNQALQRSGFKRTIMYKPLQSALHRSNNNNKKKRKRNIIWFNTPFSENVATSIGKEFFSLLSKHFPPNSRYHKIFNKQNIKLSYNCMPNMGSIIAQHNKQVLNRFSSGDTETPPCNCRNMRDCSLQEKCRTKCVIYKASVCTPNGKTMSYYGYCETDFKARYYNHKQSLKSSSKRHQTELSRLVWRLKVEGYIPVIKWSIVCRAKPYSSGEVVL